MYLDVQSDITCRARSLYRLLTKKNGCCRYKCKLSVKFPVSFSNVFAKKLVAVMKCWRELQTGVNFHYFRIKKSNLDFQTHFGFFGRNGVRVDNIIVALMVRLQTHTIIGIVTIPSVLFTSVHWHFVIGFITPTIATHLEGKKTQTDGEEKRKRDKERWVETCFFLWGEHSQKQAYKCHGQRKLGRLFSVIFLLSPYTIGFWDVQQCDW